MAITGQTFTKAFVVAGQKFYAADFLVLIAEMQALNDEVVSEAIANAGNQAVGGVKTFSSAPVFSAGINCGSSKATAMATPATGTDGANKAYADALGGSGKGFIKAWVSFDGDDGTINGTGFNVTSVVRNSLGTYTITWTTSFADDDYVISGTCGEAGLAGIVGYASDTPLAAGSAVIKTFSPGGALTDFNVVTIMAVGDQ